MQEKYLITKECTYNTILKKVNNLENELSKLSKKIEEKKQNPKERKWPMRVIILIELAILAFSELSPYPIAHPKNLPLNLLVLALGYILIQSCLDFYDPPNKTWKSLISTALRIFPVLIVIGNYAVKISPIIHR